METRTIVGQGAYTYEVDKRWARRTGGVSAFGLISGVACDSRDQVYVFHRQPEACVMVFDREGQLLSRWGEGQLKVPHGIWINDRDELYLTDTGTHLVTKWTTDGRLLQQWGTPDEPGAPGQPFNQPTYAFVAPDGEMYVSDGYGQERVHRFGTDGALRHSWGEPGTGPGQFNLPHDVCLDSRDRVLICDRQNHRVQIFDRAGTYVGEWAGLKLPMQIRPVGDRLYFCEGFQQISVRTLDNEVLSVWGSQGPGADQFTDGPHSIWVDSRGDIYVSEVVAHDKIQKYIRQ
jgi:DNA-binding beta-propeller fold protein YncE